MERTRAYRREVRNKTITRKKKIVHQVMNTDWYKHDGQYSKGKIHCGCGICKFGKKYGFPTLRTEKELSKFKQHIDDYNNH